MVEARRLYNSQGPGNHTEVVMEMPDKNSPKYKKPDGTFDAELYDTHMRQWKLDSQRDTSGGVTTEANKQYGAASEGTEVLHDPKTGKVVGTRRTVTGNVGGAETMPGHDAETPAEDAMPGGAAEPGEPKKPGPGAGLAEMAAYSKALAEYRRKKAGASASPYPK